MPKRVQYFNVKYFIKKDDEMKQVSHLKLCSL